MEMVVVGVDGSETARMAANEAASVAEAFGCPLHLVCAVGSSETVTAGSSAETWTVTSLDLAEGTLVDVAAQMPKGVDRTTAALKGKPADVLLAEAERLGADLIVVGSRRTQGMARVLGSVAKDVLAQAPCSVYVAHTTR